MVFSKNHRYITSLKKCIVLLGKGKMRSYLLTDVILLNCEVTLLHNILDTKMFQNMKEGIIY